MLRFDVSDWFWKADDARIFSSKVCALVAAEDATFSAWLNSGGIPTRWPSDDAGIQSIAALQEVLTPYGLYADLNAYAASARYLKETGGVTVNGVKVATDRESQSKINAAYTKAARDSSFTTQWKARDGTFHPLAATDIIALGDAVLAFVAACFAAESIIAAGIAAGTITTKDQVDQAIAAVAS